MPALRKLLVAWGAVNAVALGGAHLAHAAVGTEMNRLSDALSPPTHVRDGDRLMINGIPVSVSSGIEEGDPEAVAERFLAQCFPSGQQAFSPGMRWTTAQGAMALCFADEGSLPREQGQHTLVERAAAALDSGDLAQLGELRFMRVFRRSGQESVAVKLVFEGPLALARIFPSEGDASGSDLPGLPRPQHARRLLSADSGAGQVAFAVYELGAEPQATLSDYRAQLRTSQAKVRAIGDDPFTLGIQTLEGWDFVVRIEASERGSSLVALRR